MCSVLANNKRHLPLPCFENTVRSTNIMHPERVRTMMDAHARPLAFMNCGIYSSEYNRVKM